MKTKVFEQVPGYRAAKSIWSQLWVLFDHKGNPVGSFETKREANRAIPRRQTR